MLIFGGKTTDNHINEKASSRYLSVDMVAMWTWVKCESEIQWKFTESQRLLTVQIEFADTNIF